jgi:ketosteroid isomerase-like protein
MSELAAIQSQISRYTDAVNSRNWDDFPSIFAEDAIWEAAGMDFRFDGRAAITEGLSGIVGAMSMFVQMNCPAVITYTGGDRASARSTMYELGENETDGTQFEAYGRYEDELVRLNGQWLFKSRRFVRLARREGALAAQPFGAA